MIRVNKKYHIEVGQGKPMEEKSPKRRHKNQRPTCPYTQGSHKNTKLKAVIFMQKTWSRPM